MTILTVSGLGVTLGASLFDDLTFTVNKGDRIGLVAANGSGKTTLLRCLADQSEPTTGEITRARGLRIGYVPQDVPQTALRETLYDHVLAGLPPAQADYESWRVDVVLGALNVPYDLQHQTLGTLSGGWQRMAALAAAWVIEPDALLMDEPTNHLDLQRVGMLQDWLAQLPADLPSVITSHDRAFLDTVTNATLFLRTKGSRKFQLPFTPARAALDEADAADARRFANDLNKAQQLRRQAAKLKNIGINSGSDLLITKTKQLSARAEKMEAAARPAHREHHAGAIALTNSGTHAKALVTLDDVQIETPDGRPLYRTGRKWIAPGDRIVLLGPNGTGKTRLVRAIAGAFKIPQGGLKCAASIVPAYSDQHLAQLPDDETPMSAVSRRCDIADQRARGVLAAAGVGIEMQDTRIGALSGGQKARLAMLMLRLQNPNFYLLDEPTNHLDIDGQEALEAELVGHQTSCLIVTHDRSFLRNVGNRFWLIEASTLREVDSPEPFLNQQMGRD
ncbi:ABC-F family ATP-binding cassette domain-containing protein [Sulfitobacter sp. S190]|uniref:ABC-F family ATP-binding cassette domain-containing protein n=1 Tax=Sulfitobacter sp. S190 TaxID=2867022 RepID=UPI0021A5A67C|nr:ABC-F family ATP-binding cassette domain-containing protein [Sulfitobacter sp. S190]UWR21171.1 ATP-binding cassette domain-containing protein [Sulfitobacter sp. S190]